MLLIEKYLEEFLDYAQKSNVQLYNEFSFQHELGIFLRNKSELKGYQIQFERNITFFDADKKSGFNKKEIDICIFNADKSEKYAIELKFPNNGQYPE